MTKPAIHTHDDDCMVDPETMCCTVCGADHGAQCHACGGCGYHDDECPEVLEDSERAAEVQMGRDAERAWRAGKI